MKFKDYLPSIILFVLWIAIIIMADKAPAQQDTSFVQVSDIFYVKKWDNVCRERLIDRGNKKCTGVWSGASEIICDF